MKIPCHYLRSAIETLVYEQGKLRATKRAGYLANHHQMNKISTGLKNGGFAKNFAKAIATMLHQTNTNNRTAEECLPKYDEISWSEVHALGEQFSAEVLRLR